MKEDSSAEMAQSSNNSRTELASKTVKPTKLFNEFDTRIPKSLFGYRRLLCVSWCLFFIYGVLMITAGTLVVYFTAEPSTNVTCQRTFIRTAQQAIGYDSRPQQITIDDFNGDQYLDLAVVNVGSDSIDVFLGYGNGTFAPKIPRSLATGSRPHSMVQGDFNHDQLIDLAVANYGTNSIGIHFGHGNGTFRDAIYHPLGSSRPWSITVGDINRDNQSDLIVANQGVANIMILLGSHDGSFQVSTTYPLGDDSTPTSVHVDDFNLDRALDIALVDSHLSELVIFLSDGSSGYVIQRYSTGIGSHPTSLAIGDFDGDDHLDIAVTNQETHSIVAFVGSTDGSFDRNVGHYALDATTTATSIAAVDITNDTRLDLLVIDSTNDQVLIFEGHANGSFTLLTKHPTGYQSNSSFLAVGDLDGDDVPDVAISNSNTNTILVLSLFSMYLDGNQTQAFSGVVSYGVAASIVDVNGDGELDVIVGAKYDSIVSVLLGRGDGTFHDAHLFSIGRTDLWALALADMNNDGKLDIVMGQDYVSTILIYYGIGNGSFVYGEAIDLGEEIYAHSLTLADFNQDENVDIIFTQRHGNRVYILLRSDDQHSTDMTSYEVGDQSRPVFLLSVDLNKDGSMDFLVVLIANRSVLIYLNYGSGLFQEPIRLSIPDQSPTALDVGDLNGDGYLDLVFVSPPTSMIGIFLATGRNTFSNFTLLPTDLNTLPSAVTLGYFNDDTYLDIAVTNQGADALFLLLGFGDGTFGHSHVFPVGYASAPSWIAMRDLNHDGQNDLIATNAYDEIVNVFLIYQEADFLAESIHRLESGPHPFSVLVADLNNNSRSDVVVANPWNDDVQILLDHNNSTFSRLQAYQSSTGSHPQSVAAVDLNNDHHLDLVVANKWAHNIEVLLGEGNGTFDPPSTYPTGIGSSPYAIGVGNFNEDAWMDIAVVNRDAHSIQVFIGFDYSTFVQQQTLVTGVSSAPLRSAVADFDEDGFNDIAVVNYGSSHIDLFFGRGDGTFKVQASIPTGASSTPHTIKAADINHDNHFDLIVTSITFGLGVLLGKGNGSFVLVKSVLPAATSSVSFNLVDLNNDTHLDLIFLTMSDFTLVVRLGDGTGRFPHEIIHPMPDEFYSSDFKTDDLNHDQIPDVILPNDSDNTFFVLHGRGNGSFHDSLLYSTGAFFGLSVMGSGDLDNDNNTDLVFYARESQTIVVLFGFTGGEFPESVTLATGASSSISALMINDLNNDSIPDIVFTDVGSGVGNVGAFYGRGNRSFAIRKNYLLRDASQPQDLQIADLNSDDKLDLAIIDATNSMLAILLQHKKEPFATPVTLPLPSGSLPIAIAVADIDHDRHLDMIIVKSGTRTLDLLRGSGNGSFTLLPVLSTALDSPPNAVAIADFNRDDHLDFIVVLSEKNQLMMFLGDGQRQFRWASTYSTGPSSMPSAIAASDLNDDGLVDVVVCNSGTNEVMIFYGKGGATLSRSVSYALGFNAVPQSVAVGDVNGDRLTDIVVANYGNNVVEILLQICSVSDTISKQ